MIAELHLEDGKVKWKNSKCLLTKICWESMENQLDFRLCRFFRNSSMICENGTLNLKNSLTGSSSCQCSTTSIGQGKETMDFALRTQKKSRNTRRDSRTDTGRSSVLETKRGGMELLQKHLKENGTLQPLKWWNDSKIPVIQYSRVISALNSEKEE